MVWSLLLLFTGLLLAGGAAGPVAAQDTLQTDKDQGGGDAYEHTFENPERYADYWNDPARDHWQKPDAVIDAMGIEEGMTIVDLGTGTGYFLPHLADAVGEEGRVLAVDIEPAMLNYVAKMTEEKGLAHVDTVLAMPTDTHLDASSVDRILTVNVWHHIPNRAAYAKHLASRLKKGGSVWVVDYTKDSPSGPPKKHRLNPQTVVRELEKGGFEAEVRDVGLPRQYVVVGRLE